MNIIGVRYIIFQWYILDHNSVCTYMHGSFHVGSLCTSPSAYQDALARCAELFSYADSIGYHFTLLDIGGGFPGQKGTDTLFGNLSVGITEALNKHFSSSKYPDLNIIAEPGLIFHNMHAHINSALAIPC